MLYCKKRRFLIYLTQSYYFRSGKACDFEENLSIISLTVLLSVLRCSLGTGFLLDEAAPEGGLHQHT